MIPVLQQRFNVLEEKRLRFLDELSRMTEEQIAFRPHAAHWNLAQIVQHLMLVEKTFLSHTADEKYRTRRPKFPPWLGKILVWMYFRMELKVKVPVKRAIPDAVMPITQAAAMWEEMRDGFKHYFESLDANGSRQKVFFHPFMGAQDSEDFLIFLNRHFDHHMKQVQRIRNSSLFPK